jgi:excinuclease ABC subunit A
MDTSRITVKGAREHNLKNVSLTLPHGKLICFTGVSGSGKSSFAFDTLFAEGQRRYLESLSSYARQFLGQLAKPDVDHITGLSPSVSIQQKSTGWNPRSTVGTITQIQDYLRVLFARVGQQYCPKCNQAVQAQSREQIVARIMAMPAGTKIVLLAPVIRGQKGEYRDLFDDMRRKGYARARVDGAIYDLGEVPALTRNIRHHIEIVIDRVTIGPAVRPRLGEAVEGALKLGEGSLIVAVGTDGAAEGNQATRQQGNVEKGNEATGQQGNKAAESGTVDLLLSAHFACAPCGLSFEPPSPQLFSFNSPQGMCTTCDGMGETFDFDPDLIVPDPKKTFLKYAVEPMRFWGRMGKWKRHLYRGVAAKVGFDLNAPWEKLSKEARDALLYGLGDQHVTFEWRWSGGVWRHGDKFAGVLADLREKHKRAKSGFVRDYYEKYMRKAECPECKGARLNAQALAVRLGSPDGESRRADASQSEPRSPATGQTAPRSRSGFRIGPQGLNIRELSALSIQDALTFFNEIELSATQQVIARDAIKEIRARLGFLCDVGLEYLALDRPAPTLSGGESQRIRLASQIGAGLVGVLYVLDEPSIGLHPRDNQRLLDSLRRLRDMGNTVIVVEHDEQTMRTADHIVDFGPGPGVRGGEVVAEGDFETVVSAKRSITAQFLRGDEAIEIPNVRRPVQRARTTMQSRGKVAKPKVVPKKGSK